MAVSAAVQAMNERNRKKRAANRDPNMPTATATQTRVIKQADPSTSSTSRANTTPSTTSKNITQGHTGTMASRNLSGGVQAVVNAHNKREAEKSAKSTLPKTSTGKGTVIKSKKSDEYKEMMAEKKAPPTSEVKTATSTTPSSQGYIEQLNEARRKQAMADLDKSRQQAMTNLDREKSTIQPQYYDKKNQVAAQNQQSARNFQEFMANRGGTNAGSNAQAELSRNNALQGNLGSLGRQEQAAYDDIAMRRTGFNNAYASDVQSAQYGLEGDKMQALINQRNADRQFGLQEGGLTGNYLGGRTLQGQQFDYGQQVDNRNFDYRQGRDQVGDRRYDEQFGYQRQRDQVGDQRYDREFDYQQGRDQVTDNRYDEQFDYQQNRDARRDYETDRLYNYGMYRDNVGDQQWQQQFEQNAQERAEQMGYNWAQLDQRERQFVADMEMKNQENQMKQRANQFSEGMTTYSQTGQMPDYMSELGVNTEALKQEQFAGEVAGLYEELMTGGTTPEQALQLIDISRQSNLKPDNVLNELEKTIYMFDPSMDPNQESNSSPGLFDLLKPRGAKESAQGGIDTVKSLPQGTVNYLSEYGDFVKDGINTFSPESLKTMWQGVKKTLGGG